MIQNFPKVPSTFVTLAPGSRRGPPESSLAPPSPGISAARQANAALPGIGRASYKGVQNAAQFLLASLYFTSCFEFWTFACTLVQSCAVITGGWRNFSPAVRRCSCSPPRLLVGIVPEVTIQAPNMPFLLARSLPPPFFFLFWRNTLAVWFVC